MTGMTPRSMAIASRLIFWYLLTLQKSVMHTVNFRCRRENAEHCPPTGTHILDASLDHLLKALENLPENDVSMRNI